MESVKITINSIDRKFDTFIVHYTYVYNKIERHGHFLCHDVNSIEDKAALQVERDIRILRIEEENNHILKRLVGKSFTITVR